MKMEAGTDNKTPTIKSVFKILLPFAVAALFLLVLYLLYNALKEYHYHDLVARLRSYSSSTIMAALALTLINYLILSCYDMLAARYVQVKIPLKRIVFTSFLSYVFSYNIGLSLFGSSALRYRFYSAWGLEGGSIARIIAFCVSTFWLGLAIMGGLSLLIAPPAATTIPILATSSRIIGLLLLLLAISYLLACLSGKAELRFRSFALKLPSIRIAIPQALVSSLDWIFAGLVLYVLLPEGKPAFLSFIAIFATAQLAGATSHVPGGLGVVETVMVLSLSAYAPTDALFGALLAYRAIYYLVPLCVAVLAFVSHEIYTVRTGVAQVANRAAKFVMPLVPAVLAASVFISGAILLFSGATPAVKERLFFLEPFVPLPLLELSHFTASLVGLALIVIADGLRRRIDLSYFLSLLLLASGALFSLLKGFDWEEALILSTVFLLILPSRKLFQRRAAILSRGSILQWVIGFGAVLVGSIWLGLFSQKHVQYSHDLWWVFELKKDAPRFMRASLGVSIASAVIAFRAFLRPVPRLKYEKLAECEADVRRILSVSRSSNANLALLGDKFFLFDSERKAFLMYGKSGNTLIVMGDPVGEEEAFSTLVWDFYELTRKQGVRAVWYEINAANLPIFVELGARIYKIGEEAIVDLASFSLEGGQAKRLRPPRNKLIREGYSFTVYQGDDLRKLFPQLKTVSDDWLTDKKSKEKGFSLGYFDESYLLNFPVAVVKNDQGIVAFANLWPQQGIRELSVDLMRHTKAAPSGTMEFLFIECMFWGKEQGYQAFNLGMAPLSGVEARDAAPLWNKAVALIFRSGEGIYNFQGLRAFKEKFSPEWGARYIAISANAGGVSLPVVAADIALLISRGFKTKQAVNLSVAQ
ncbi:bifunctional lysylphosphatidylglycerol flippase/synthetase MprF [Treponema sp.]